MAIGYSLGLFLDGKPHGYIVYDFRVEGSVLEFSFDEGAVDKYTEIIEKAENDNSIPSVEKSINAEAKVYEVSPLEYSTQIAENEFYSTSEQNYDSSELDSVQEQSLELDQKLEEQPSNIVVPEEERDSASKKYADHAKVLVTTYPSGYSWTAQRYWNQFIADTEATTEAALKKWCCGISALWILSQSTGLEGNLKTAYNSLWSLGGTTTTHTSNGVSYGSIANNKIGPAFQQFAAKYGVRLTYANTNSPSFNIFKSAIDTRKPAILAYGIQTSNGRSGHAVPIEGYMIGKSGSATTNFLVAANDWNWNVCYINYDPAKFLDSYGIVWTGITTR